MNFVKLEPSRTEKLGDPPPKLPVFPSCCQNSQRIRACDRLPRRRDYLRIPPLGIRGLWDTRRVKRLRTHPPCPAIPTFRRLWRLEQSPIKVEDMNFHKNWTS